MLLLCLAPVFTFGQVTHPTSITTAEYMYVMPSLQERLREGTFTSPVPKNKEVNPRRGTPSKLDNPNALPLDGDPLAKKNTEINIHQGKSAPILTFDALTNGTSSPTDPTGAVGPNHYVNAYNSGFRIYDRMGNPLVPHASLNTIWPNENRGDPIVLYDRFADRWFIAQFSSTPNGVLLAYSQGPDPVNDGWFTYRFNTSTFPDYEKFSIWSDGIYMTANKDLSSPTTSGRRLCF